MSASDLSEIKDQTTDAKLHRTNNDLKNNAKAVAAELLQKALQTGIDLSLITKQAHWNLKGLQFIGIHLMLDKFRTEQDEYNDTMAERLVQLGGTAKGTTQTVAAGTRLPPYPTDIYAVTDHIKALIDHYAIHANAVRASIEEADEAGDADTADIFTEVSRGLDKQLWFLEAHVQEESGKPRL